MKLHFYKYQGAGNDFILVDNRKAVLNKKQTALIRQLCDRRFGIGADGLILLEEHPDYDFEMIYFNADGNEGSMCGNGGRCIVAFARHIKIIENEANFLAVDGPHEAVVLPTGEISLKMGDVSSIEENKQDFILDTGSPHYVRFLDDLKSINIFKEGQAIRYNDRFKAKGINVNFVKINPKGLEVATYERGVEAETLACGTGVTACAIAYHIKTKRPAKDTIQIQAKGGQLSVRLSKDAKGYSDIWLQGPAEYVFEGRFFLMINCELTPKSH